MCGFGRGVEACCRLGADNVDAKIKAKTTKSIRFMIGPTAHSSLLNKLPMLKRGVAHWQSNQPCLWEEDRFHYKRISVTKIEGSGHSDNSMSSYGGAPSRCAPSTMHIDSGRSGAGWAHTNGLKIFALLSRALSVAGVKVSRAWSEQCERDLAKRNNTHIPGSPSML